MRNAHVIGCHRKIRGPPKLETFKTNHKTTTFGQTNLSVNITMTEIRTGLINLGTKAKANRHRHENIRGRA